MHLNRFAFGGFEGLALLQDVRGLCLAAAELALGKFQVLFIQRNLVLQERGLAVLALKVEPSGRDFAAEAQCGGSELLFGGFQIQCGRFGGSIHTPPEIEFIAGGEAHREAL